MKKMWVVRIVQEPIQGDWPKGWFPRRYYYKRDAEWLANKVREKGGKAVVEREK